MVPLMSYFFTSKKQKTYRHTKTNGTLCAISHKAYSELSLYVKLLCIRDLPYFSIGTCPQICPSFCFADSTNCNGKPGNAKPSFSKKAFALLYLI